MAGYLTRQQLLNGSVDAETLDAFSNGAVGAPNVNRAGNNVKNLATIRTEVLDAASGVANIRTYLTKAAMQADTGQPVPTTGRVTNDPTLESNGDYVWNGSVWVWSEIQPATTESVARLDLRANALETLIHDGVQPILSIANEEGAVVVSQDDETYLAPTFSVTGSASELTGLGDVEGGRLVLGDDTETWVGPMCLQPLDMPGVFVVNEQGEVLDYPTSKPEDPANPGVDSPFDMGVFFGSKLAIFEGYSARLELSSMLSIRSRVERVIGCASSTSTAFSRTGMYALDIPGDLEITGGTLVLSLRDKLDLAYRQARDIQVVPVGMQGAPVTQRVMIIGDSIVNRQLITLMAPELVSRNFSPEWVGTLNTSSVSNNANDASGPLAEAREGWESGDFTGAVTDRISIVSPGGEAGYLAMIKTDRVVYNPFLRLATPEDPAEDVRNGWILDFAYYASRFGLAAPDQVVITVGTNDARDRSASEISQAVLDNDRLIYKRLKLAWPSVKILRALPGTARQDDREELWTTKYAAIIRSLMQAASEYGATVASTWALQNPEGDYTLLPRAADPVTGFRTTTYSDSVHPTSAGRVSLARNLAAHIAAKSLNLI